MVLATQHWIQNVVLCLQQLDSVAPVLCTVSVEGTS